MKQDLNGVRTPEDVVRRFDLGEIPLIVKSQKEITLEVSKKVNGNEVISAINLTPEEAKITAEKIALEGYTTINNGFSVDEQGNMTCNNASINGSVIVNGSKFSVDELGNLVCSDATMNNAHIVNGSIDITQDEGSTTTPITLKQTANNEEFKSTYGSGGIQFFRNDINTAGLYGYDNSGGKLFLKNLSGETTVSIIGESNNSSGRFSIRNSNGESKIHGYGDTGNLTCVTLTQTSLEEKKKDFEKFENGLDIVKNVDIYKYHFKEEKETDKKHIGFVIGDKFNYREEITSKDNDEAELYSMISVLWRAVQEQQAEIERLKEGKK